MNDHDLRQLTKMYQQVNSYRDGNIGLSVLLGDLIFLRDVLSETSSEWECEFNHNVIDLESAYSYALEKNSGKLDLVTTPIVDGAISKLLELLHSTIGLKTDTGHSNS